MGAAVGVGNISDYLNQGTGVSDTPSGIDIPGIGTQGSISPTGILTNLGVPQPVTDIVGVGVSGTEAVLAGGLNPIADVQFVASIGQTISDLIGAFSGVPREAKTDGMYQWLLAQGKSDYRYSMLALYLAQNILGQGLVMSSTPRPGANWYSYCAMIDGLVGPLPYSGRIVKIPVSGTKQGMGIPFVSAAAAAKNLNVDIPTRIMMPTPKGAFFGAFGFAPPTSGPGTYHLLVIAALAGQLEQRFANALVGKATGTIKASLRGQVIAKIADKLIQSNADPNAFLQKTQEISTKDLTNALDSTRFQQHGDLNNLCVCGDASDTGSCASVFSSNDVHTPTGADNNLGSSPPPTPVQTPQGDNMGAGIPASISNQATGGSASSQGGASSVSVNISTPGPDAALEQLLSEELAVQNPSSSQQPSTVSTGEWVLIAIAGATLVAIVISSRGSQKGAKS